MKPILVSGIQPSGRMHIGNYLGALKNFVDLQNSGKYQCFFFIADLHSLTESSTPKEKSAQILELLADYLAAGLDPKKSTIFLQSQIPAHSELSWILGTITPMGELRRMTQYKEKSENEKDGSNAGLFTYPTLMAADILLYDAKHVPVGEDQLQHLELTRTITRKFNSKYGKTFIEPQPILTASPRIMSLGDPKKKMSKSQPQTCLFLDEHPDEIVFKIKRAVTDSDNKIIFDLKNKPGLSNLLLIFASLSEKPIKIIEKEFSNKNYGEFKLALADLMIKKLSDYRKNKKTLLSKSQNLKNILNSGCKIANTIANKKIAIVKKKIGLSF